MGIRDRFSIALVLFVFIMVINVLLNAVLQGGNKDEKLSLIHI